MSENQNERKWPALCVDIETLDTRPTAVVLQVGAVFFDPKTGEMGERFLMDIDPDTQIERTRSEATVQWWEDQVLNGRVMPGREAAQSLGLFQLLFADWYLKSHCDLEKVEVWAWGMDFDFPILADLKINNWRYSNQRDARTLCKALGVVRQGKVSHHALEDAVQEVQAIVQALAILDLVHEPDLEGGWEAYRRDLFETGYGSLDIWEKQPEQIQEAFAAGVRKSIGAL